jgi:ATP-dependent Clp protease ATP-binding subunit ClpB
MSEFQERHAVSRLVGAPPGYVGYDEGGQLTEAVRRRPYSIILLDEIEKAHPDTFNVLLQVLDDGRLTDNKGRVADFKNSIIIMTSNMGSETILENFEDLQHVGVEHHQEIIETTKAEVFELLKENLRPEFLNRIDDKIMFLPLTRDEIKQILRILLRKVHKNLGLQGIKMELSERAIDLLADLGYDPQFGARPMKRVLQKDLVNELAKEVLSGNYVNGETVYVHANAMGLTFSDVKPQNWDEVKLELNKDRSKGNGSDLKKQKDLDTLVKATKDLKEATKDLKEATDDLKEEGGKEEDESGADTDKETK